MGVNEHRRTDRNAAMADKTHFETASNKSRLRWRCRRGMKELDVLMGGFLERHFDELGASLQAAFAELVEQPDPTIADWIWGRAPVPGNGMGDIIRMIRADSGVDQQR